MGALVAAGCVCDHRRRPPGDERRPDAPRAPVRDAASTSRSWSTRRTSRSPATGAMTEGPARDAAGAAAHPALGRGGDGGPGPRARWRRRAGGCTSPTSPARAACAWSARRSGGACASPPRPTPHHFTLTDEAVEGYDTHAKMNPPLRLRTRRGRASARASPTAPSTPSPPTTRRTGVLDKQVEFDEAVNGVVGLETALALTLALVRDGRAEPASRAVELLTDGPGDGLRAAGRPPGARGSGGRDARRPRRGVDGRRGAVPLQEPEHPLRWADGSRAG